MSETIPLIGSGIALGISAFFMAKSAVEITEVKEWEKDKDLREGHKWMSWAAVVGWVSVGLVILLVIIYIILIFALGGGTAGWVVKGSLLIILTAMAIAGVLSALGATRIRNSPLFKEADKKGAFRDAIIAAILVFVGFVIIGGLFLWALLYHPVTLDEETKKLEESLEKQEVETKEAGLETKEAAFKAKTSSA
uniref:Transmembrane protein n=1 Tax=Pithovirus LCPAC201 TaxID=2506591 RepID=A0A481Z6J4_9VIRU|nr:MAG: uncharacterized protein LCPAC201_00500 [Pithovirus LCPAC201]